MTAYSAVGLIPASKQSVGGEKMVKIKKANGELVPFDKERLVVSIINANVDRTIAEGIADKTPVTDGMLSSELRSVVSEQLREYDPVSAEIYSTKGKLSARSSEEPSEGIAHLSLSAMERLKVKVGDIIDLLSSDS